MGNFVLVFLHPKQRTLLQDAPTRVALAVLDDGGQLSGAILGDALGVELGMRAAVTEKFVLVVYLEGQGLAVLRVLRSDHGNVYGHNVRQ